MDIIMQCILPLVNLTIPNNKINTTSTAIFIQNSVDDLKNITIRKNQIRNNGKELTYTQILVISIIIVSHSIT